MWKISLALRIRFFPKLDNIMLNPSECLFFRNACVGNAVQSLFQQLPFLVGSQIAVEFWAYLRDEERFDTPEQLSAAIAEDVRRTRDLVRDG